jgi:hypothetical protein
VLLVGRCPQEALSELPDLGWCLPLAAKPAALLAFEKLKALRDHVVAHARANKMVRMDHVWEGMWGRWEVPARLVAAGNSRAAAHGRCCPHSVH